MQFCSHTARMVSVMSKSQWSTNPVSTVISNIAVEAKGFYPLLILVNDLPTNFPAIWMYCQVLLWLKSASLIFEFSLNYTRLARLAIKAWLCKDPRSLSLTSNVKLAQLGRYQSGSQQVPGSIPTGGSFFCWIYFTLPCISLYCQHCQLCIIKGKLDCLVKIAQWKREWKSEDIL